MSKKPRRRNAFDKPEVPKVPLEPIDAIPRLLSQKPVLEQPGPPKTTTRDRSWDAKRSKTTYDLPPELIQKIKDIAGELGEERAMVKVSDVARLLLETGIEQYEAGELKAKPRPTGFTLFDD